jgi:hypothetical protein
MASCGSWTAFSTTSPPVSKNTLQCATSTRSAIEARTSGGPWSPFYIDTMGGTKKKDTTLWQFCEYLTDPKINFTIFDVGIESGPVAGVCELWHYSQFYATLFKDYRIVFQLAWDPAGCSGPKDKYKDGVNMPDYGTDDCYHAFQDLLLKKCELA